MSWEEAVAADAEVECPRIRRRRPRRPAWRRLLEQGMRVGAGMVSAGASAVADALRSTMPESADEEGEDPAATMAGAGLGAAITAAEAAASAAKSAAEAVGPLMSWVTNPAALQGASETAAGAARLLDGQWKATQAETAQAATAFLTVLIPEITTAILDQVDLTQIVKERVDINAIVEDVDMDRIVDRLDIAAIVDRVDVNAVVQKRRHGADRRGPADREGRGPRRRQRDRRTGRHPRGHRSTRPGRDHAGRDGRHRPAVDHPRVLGRDGQRDGADRPGARHGSPTAWCPRSSTGCCGASIANSKLPASRRTTDVADTATHRLAHVYPAGAGERQGLRAGVVSRTVAMVIDAAYVVVLVGGGLPGFLRVPIPPQPQEVLLARHLIGTVHHRGAHPGRHRPRARLGRRRTHRRDADHGFAHRGPLGHHARVHGRAPACDHLRRVPDRIVLVGA